MLLCCVVFKKEEGRRRDQQHKRCLHESRHRRKMLSGLVWAAPNSDSSVKLPIRASGDNAPILIYL